MDHIQTFLVFATVLFAGSLVQGKKASLSDLLSFARHMRDIDDPLHDECSAEPEDRQPCGRRYNTIGKWECKARGCCYDDRDRVEEGTIHCFLAHRMLADEQCDVKHEDKDDCGYYEMDEAVCLKKGCCWRPSERVNAPECYKKKVAVPTTTASPQPGASNLKLMDFDTESDKYGRVEVFFDGEWGTVCDDGFGKEEADVICRQRGYASGVPKYYAEYGIGVGPIWLDEMACTGSESSFFDCDHMQWGQHDCSHSEDAAVECYNAGEEPEPTEPPSHSGDYYYYNDDQDEDYWEGVEYQSRLKPGRKLAKKMH